MDEKIEFDNQHFNEALKLAHIGTWEWDIPGNKLTWSRELYRIFNLSAREFKPDYESYLSKIHPDDRGHADASIKKATADLKPFDFYHRIILPDNSIRQISCRGKILVHDGAPVKMIGISQDVTESKESIALKDSEERYRTLAETATEAIITLNQDSSIEYFNSATAKLFCYSLKEVMFKKLDIFIPDLLKEDHSDLNNYLKTGVKSPGLKSIELTGVKKDGQVFPIEVSFGQFSKDQSNYFTVTIHDLTERKKAEDQLREAKEKAEQMSQARQEFLSVMSHEMRTPLNAVIGITHLLMEDKLTPEQEENINILSFSAQNLLALINNILDFSKIESGKLQLEKIEFDLNHLIKRLMDSFRHSAQEKQVKLKLNTEIDLPEQLEGDPVRLTQVLTNLIHNAIKFTDHGDVCLSVKTLSAKSSNVVLQFEIADTGIGIEPDRLQQIFDSYTQAKPSITRQFGGTGLGLTIVKKLVKMMGGDIEVTSEINKGSVFSFHLSFGVSSNAVQKQADHRHEKDFNLAGINILLVEDNVTNRVLAKKFIAKWGAAVHTAENGMEAVKKVSEHTFDIVLMDLQMPVMDGYAANRLIRDMGYTAEKLPVIALSAYMLDEVKTKVRAAGMNDFLPKPIDPHELYRKIVKNLKRRMRNEVSVLMEESMQGVSTIRQLMETFDSDFRNEFVKMLEKEFTAFVSHIHTYAREHNKQEVHQVIHKITPSVKRFNNEMLMVHLEDLKMLVDSRAVEISIEKKLQHITHECNNILNELKQMEENESLR